VQNTGLLADRQWSVFVDNVRLLLNYNQQVPRNIVVHARTTAG